MPNTHDPKKPYIISVAGTKGKTTVVRLLSHIYTELKRPTLLVDTDGHYLNGKQLSTYEDSMNTTSLVPTVSPGRYLRDLTDKENTIAILETAIGSANIYGGLGYRHHNIGVFTNVLEDHIGEGIPNRERLAELKAKYIFSRIAAGGTAIFNADDEYVCNELERVPKDKKILLLPVGIDFKYFDLENHRNLRGRAFTMKGDTVTIIRGKRSFPVINAKKIPWTFDGKFYPSIMNLMFASAAAFVENKHKLTADVIESIRQYRSDDEGGRLVLFENKRNDIRVLVDYAHEKYSLKEVAGLANEMTRGKSIGIIRLAPDRTDKLLKETGRYLANEFDITIIYDKIDGIKRSKVVNARTGQVRRTGQVSRIVYEAMRGKSDKEHKVVHKVIEGEAVEHAFSLAKKGDFIVHITGDNHEKSLKLIKKHLGSRLFVSRQT